MWISAFFFFLFFSNSDENTFVFVSLIINLNSAIRTFVRGLFSSWICNLLRANFCHSALFYESRVSFFNSFQCPLFLNSVIRGYSFFNCWIWNGIYRALKIKLSCLFWRYIKYKRKYIIWRVYDKFILKITNTNKN